MAARAACRPARLMARLTFLNVKTPRATTSGVFGFVSTTTPTHEEQMHVFYYDQGACVQSRD